MTKFQKLALVLIIIAAVTLRFYKLGSNPPGLYWDEAAYGYDAYSILKTANDHHGHFLPLFFESFGDWKLPIYHYLLVPSIAAFGLNEFAVRLPSAFFGSLSIPLFFLFIKKLTKNLNLALLSTLFLAISAWHIQFSRGGFESNVGLFFVMLGVYVFLLALERPKSQIFTLSFLLLTLSMYTYHAYRIFTPLLMVALIFIFLSEIKKNLPKIILPAQVTLIVFLPLLVFTFSPQGRLRAQSQSAFQEKDFKKADLDYNQKSKKPLRFLSKYWYQKPVYYAYISINEYFDHFSPSFLFLRGDRIGRHSQVDMGQLHLFEAPLIIAGLFALSKLNKKTLWILGAWILLAPIPAVIVNVTPHANRTLQLAPIFAFLSALGTVLVFSKIKSVLPHTVIIVIATYYFISYLHLLFVHYPVKFSPDWQDGNRQMVQNVQKFQDKFDEVYITNGSEAYIYLLFYLKYDPKKFIAEGGTKDGFDKYVFVESSYDLYNKGRLLYVSPSWQRVDGKKLANIYDTGDRLVYGIWEVGGQD